MSQLLQNLFSDPSLTVRKLFSHKNITTQIKNNIEYFVNYSRRHKQFIFQCIRISLHSTYNQLQQQQNQNIAHNINEVFSCDQTVIADLFFWPEEPNKRKESRFSAIEEEEITEAIIEETQFPQSNIQTEAERLFESQENIKQTLENQINQKPIELQKDQLAKFTFKMFKFQQQDSSQINESSLGYLYKIWSFLIRNNSNQALAFFSQNRQYCTYLLQNLRYYSISNLLAQLLVSEDKTRQYKYEQFKKQMFETIIEILLKDKQDEQVYDSLMILIQEILNNSKQSYYEYFEDFKRLVDYFGKQQVLNKFYEIILNGKEEQVRNSLKYLEKIFERINSESEQTNDHFGNSANEGQISENKIVFETDIFIKNIEKLIEKLAQISSYSTINKIQYISLISEILKTKSCQQRTEIDYTYLLQSLFTTYKTINDKGIYKIKFSNLIQVVIKKCTSQQISFIINSLQEPVPTFQPFKTIKTLKFDNKFAYNKNQHVAFECKMIIEMNKIKNGVIEELGRLYDRDIKRINNYYETKIANFGKLHKNISVEEQGGFFNFNESFQNLKLGEKNNYENDNSNSSLSFTLNLPLSFNNSSSNEPNLVGKNNISIPLLNLSQQKKNGSISQRHSHNSINCHTKQSLNNKDNIYFDSEQSDEIPEQIEEVIRLDAIKIDGNEIKLTKLQLLGCKDKEKKQKVEIPHLFSIKEEVSQSINKLGSQKLDQLNIRQQNINNQKKLKQKQIFQNKQNKNNNKNSNKTTLQSNTQSYNKNNENVKDKIKFYLKHAFILN